MMDEPRDERAVRAEESVSGVPGIEPERHLEPVRQPDASNRPAPLLPGDECDQYRHRWSSIQTGFVDEPRKAVEQADALVEDVMMRLSETFSNERSHLEEQWSRGADASTEDLRIALQHYRSFFDRLLSL
jgi:hypothetical protein